MRSCETLTVDLFSWLSSNHAAGEQPLNSQYSGWPSTVNTSNQPSPSRREHVVQPLLLTTALNAAQFHHASTPLSTTSLSSPFTQGLSPAVSSPSNGRSASSSSSMASRQYSVPYNPQDWGPVGGNPVQAAYSQQSPMHHAAPQQRHHGGWWLSDKMQTKIPKY